MEIQVDCFWSADQGKNLWWDHLDPLTYDLGNTYSFDQVAIAAFYFQIQFYSIFYSSLLQAQ